MAQVSPTTANRIRIPLVGWHDAVSLETATGLDAAPLASTRPRVSLHPTT